MCAFGCCSSWDPIAVALLVLWPGCQTDSLAVSELLARQLAASNWLVMTHHRYAAGLGSSFCSLLLACLLPCGWKRAGGRWDRVGGGPPPWSTGCLSQAPGLWRPAASRGSLRSGLLPGSKTKGRRANSGGPGRRAAHRSATRVDNNPGRHYVGERLGLLSFVLPVMLLLSGCTCWIPCSNERCGKGYTLYTLISCS